MARELLRSLGWMLVAATTSITDVLTLVGLAAFPALALSFSVGLFAPILAAVAGVAAYIGAAQGRKQFAEGFVFEHDEDVEPLSRGDLVGLVAYVNISLLLAAVIGKIVGTAVPDLTLVVAAAIPVIEMVVGSRRWFLSPSSVLVTVGSAAVGHGIEIASLLREFHDDSHPLRQRIRPGKGT